LKNWQNEVEINDATLNSDGFPESGSNICDYADKKKNQTFGTGRLYFRERT
jgi:hypothetical protein